MSDWWEKLARWKHLTLELATLKAEEQTLREQLFHSSFPTPKEGANTVELPNGSKLKGIYKLNRTPIQEKVVRLHPDILSTVFAMKYDLRVGEYKRMPDGVRKAVDECLIIKPGMPSLELVEAKE